VTDHAPTTGPPDRQTLRLLERTLAADPLVGTTGFDPDAYEPRSVRASLDVDRYPASVEEARLELRWFVSDDFSIQYVESNHERWLCRWDRHPNPHNARLHVHRPPDGTEVTDTTLASTHPLDVLSTVIATIERRIERHWERDM